MTVLINYYKFIKILFVLFINFYFCNATNIHLDNSNRLLMVHALFRHGERTTENFYPNDPHINSTFFPFGIGELTNRGKYQEYKLGSILRDRYNNFLGEIYTSDIMHVRSTDFKRTRVSALLVAAGLWPPHKSQIWHENLPWIPIPVDYKAYEEEDLLNPQPCEKRRQVINSQLEIEEAKEKYIKPYKNMMNYIEKHSGQEIRTPNDLLDFFLILRTEVDTNLTLPDWTKTIFPDPLTEAASLVYSYFNYNPEIKKINAGYFFKKILNDFDSKLQTNKLPKIFLYCAHESTLGHILSALNYKPHVTPYSSVILLELHKNKDNSEHFMKILYKAGVEDTALFEEIIIPGCQKNVCTLQEMKMFLKEIIPVIPYKEACRV